MSDFATEIVSIHLPGGWSGRVMTGTAPAFPPDAAPSALPTIDRWRSELIKLVSDPASLPGYETLKYSKDGQVFRARIEVEGRGAEPEPETMVGTGYLDIIGKQSRVHGVGRRLAAVFGRLRERRNFARGMTLQQVGINTAAPLALIERRRPRREAWLVTMYLEDVMDLDQVALRVLPSLAKREARRVKRHIIEAVVDTLIRLERNGFTHRDFKSSNVLVQLHTRTCGLGAMGKLVCPCSHSIPRARPADKSRSEGALVKDAHAALNPGELEEPGRSVSVWLVDLDGLQRCRWRRVSRRWQSIVRLAASLLNCSAVTRGDHARFLKCYVARSESPGNNWRELYTMLADRAHQYVSHAARRKTDKLDGFTGEG